jgi:glyoxylase-like metal-dependent hydrolase (beta-lactamase superfamily II)
VVLVIDNGKKILVDPGTNAEQLLNSLNSQDLTPDDIDMIFLSHYHPDHFINIRLFPKTDIYDQMTRWHKDEEYFYKEKLPGTDIDILPTPGHSPEHTSLLVKTEEGIVCIAQDVFWWEDGKQKYDNEDDLLNLEDPFVNDKEALLNSRKLVLEKADWIIPGHGKKFRVKK